jgi:hypothetical protein
MPQSGPESTRVFLRSNKPATTQAPAPRARRLAPGIPLAHPASGARLRVIVYSSSYICSATKRCLGCSPRRRLTGRFIAHRHPRSLYSNRGKKVGQPAFFACPGSNRSDSVRMCRRHPPSPI